MNTVMGHLLRPAVYLNDVLGLARALALLCAVPVAVIATLAYGAINNAQFTANDLLSFALLAILLTLYLAAGLHLHLRQRLQRISEQTLDISRGDFQHITPSNHQDVLAEVENHIARLAKSFERLIIRITQSASETHSASRSELDIAQRNAESAARQAEAVSEVATATKEMAASVAQVTEQINDIKAISEQTEAHAGEGEQVVNDAISSIRDISSAVRQSLEKVDSLGQRSSQINEIIDVIEEIANQTNLLALNAAIEAARAGEHGRGFAVVSDEVRQLAIRTHEATQKVGEMIRGIQDEIEGTIQGISGIDKQVSRSLELSDSATEKLHAIREGANQTAESMHLAASAITQQSQVCEVIRSNLDAINDMTLEARQDAVETKDTAVYLETLSQRVLATLPGKTPQSGAC